MFKAIDIDFEVYKALTSRLPSETSSYNDVVRELLNLPAVTSPPGAAAASGGWTWKGVTLPNGTELRANHKGQVYTATIEGGRWMQNDEAFSSPSAAGWVITQTGLNGWTFWSAKRPGDTGWSVLNHLRTEAQSQSLRSAA